MQYWASLAVPMIASALGRPDRPDSFHGVIQRSGRPRDYIRVGVNYGKFSIAVIFGCDEGRKLLVREPSLCIVDDTLITGKILDFLDLLASLLPEPYLRRLLRQNSHLIKGERSVIQLSPTFRVEQVALPLERRGQFMKLMANINEALPPILIYRVNAREPIYTVTPSRDSVATVAKNNKTVTLRVPSSHYNAFTAPVSSSEKIWIVPVPPPVPGLYPMKRFSDCLKVIGGLVDVDVVCFDQRS